MIITATTTIGSPILTGIKNTFRLNNGNFIYGIGVPVETKILSIDSLTTLTMNKNATASGTVIMTVSFSTVGMFHAERCAKKDALDAIIALGDQFIFTFRGEDDVDRDRYGSVLKTENIRKLFIPAYPIVYKPTTRQLQEVGLKEQTDIAITTSMLSWDSQGIDFEEIKTELTSVSYRGTEYKIEELTPESEMGSSFLYLNFGINKK